MLLNGRCWRILLQKFFWDDERKFLEPLLHFARAATWGTNQEEWAQATPA
jgi:hypothetical protein